MQDMAAGRGNGWRIAGWSLAALLMMVPMVGMRVSDEWKWSPGDFVFAAVMIGGTGLLFELAVRSSKHWAYRVGAAVALVATFLLIWINAAAGIIGDEGNPANLLFLGVIAVALAGALVARFRPQGMARAMLVAAVAEAMIGVAVRTLGWGADEPPGMLGVQILNGFFVALWLVSAALFRAAARQRAAISAGP